MNAQSVFQTAGHFVRRAVRRLTTDIRVAGVRVLDLVFRYSHANRAENIPPSEVLDGTVLRRRIEQEVIDLLKASDRRVVAHRYATPSSIILAHTGKLSGTRALIKAAMARHYQVDLHIGGPRGGVRVRMRDGRQLWLTLILIGRWHVEAMWFYKQVAADAHSRMLSDEFAVRVEGVRQAQGWWQPLRGDTVIPPFTDEFASKLSLPNTLETSIPIDVVYTWVDGNDPVWAARRDKVMESLGMMPGGPAMARNRWENREELRYSLRSVALFAPWVRNIHIVTDNQVPGWFKPDPTGRVRLVHHHEIFPDPGVLPSFNSHSIESVLHRIEGLSEHFIYMNDDLFFGLPVTPDTFFSAGGLPRVFLAPHFLPIGPVDQLEAASEWGGANASNLLEQDLGVIINHKLKHTPRALVRSLLYEMEDKFAGTYAKLRRTPFRSTEDVAPVSALYSHYALARGLAAASRTSELYVDLGNRHAGARFDKLRKAPVRMLCVNDTDLKDGGNDWETRDRLLRDYLRHQYPWKSPWEM